MTIKQIPLTNCDQEPIHTPSAIQPFGALFALENNIIVAVSENSLPLLGLEAKDLLGLHVFKVLDTNSKSILLQAQRKKEPTSPAMVRLSTNKQWITAVAFQQGDKTVVECEHLEDEKQQEITSLKFVSEKHENLLAYLAFVSEGVRRVTGYDRVMIYKFAEDWHGEVIAESKKSQLSSFYGHHFPASDIPEPARRLFTANWVRMISDVNYAPVKIIASSEEPLDLTLSALRSVSPIHIQYLHNMNVGASLTLSIICDGRLWGLIACHHLTAKYLPAHLRSVCTLIAKMISSRVTAIEIEEQRAAFAVLSRFVTEMEGHLNKADHLAESIGENKHELWKLIKSDGFNLISRDYSTSDGHGLEPDHLDLLLELLADAKDTVVYYTNLHKAFPQASSVYSGGILAVHAGDDWLIWNKRELVQTITWAGNPNKENSNGESNPAEQLSPRTSFADWQEQIRGTCTPWQQYEVEIAEQLCEVILAAAKGKILHIQIETSNYLESLNQSIEETLTVLHDQIEL